jgi:hypothetical protein
MELSSVLDLIQDKTITPKNASIKDLARACNWLESYEFNGELSGHDLIIAQAFANVIGLLNKEITRRNQASLENRRNSLRKKYSNN